MFSITGGFLLFLTMYGLFGPLMPAAKRPRSITDLALGIGDGHVLPMGNMMADVLPDWNLPIPRLPSPRKPAEEERPLPAPKQQAAASATAFNQS